MNKRPIFSFHGQINKIMTRRDGGGRVEIDFDGDSLEPIQIIQRMQVQGDINFAFAMVPYYPADGEPVPKVSVEDHCDDNE
jgi:hypothetical protein